MKKVKTYEDFVNEEINLKKAAAGIALAAGMAFSNPANSQTVQTVQKLDTTKSEDGKLKDNVDVVFKPPLAEEDTHLISGFRNYKLGDTKIYGNKVLSEIKSNELKLIFYVKLQDIRDDGYNYGHSNSAVKAALSILYEGINLNHLNIIWFEKKEFLFDKSINIYFGYVDNKLMCISIECTNSEINDDILELLESKFGEPSYKTKQGSYFWKESREISPSSLDYLKSNYGSEIDIYNEEFLNYISLKNKEKEEKEKAERKKKINSETF